MLFTDFMTKRVQVPQPIFDGLHKFLDGKQMVDAVATVGGYNFVSRFVVALNVDGKMDVAGACTDGLIHCRNGGSPNTKTQE